MQTHRICFIHVGTAKTGSSALQYAIAQAQDELRRHGYHFPNLRNNLKRMQSGKPTGGNASPIWRALRDHDVSAAVEVFRPLTSLPGHIVLSSEGLHNAASRPLDEFCSAVRSMGYDLKCLVFYRPQVELLVSTFLQQVKSKGRDAPSDLSEFAAGFDYEKRDWYLAARRLEAAFGIKNLTVRWYPEVLRRGDILKAAFDWLGLPAPQIALPRVNPSPGWEAFQILRALNSHGFGGRKFSDRLLNVARDKSLLGARMALDTETASKVHEATRASNEALLRRYCPELSPDDELRTPAPYNAPAVDEAVIDSLTAIAAEMLIGDGIDPAVVAQSLGANAVGAKRTVAS